MKGSTAMAGRSSGGTAAASTERNASGRGVPCGARAPLVTLGSRKRAAYISDEAKTLARDGADHGLVLAAVADRRSRGVDAAGQRRFRDDAAVPDALDQIVLGDDAVAVLYQVDQQIEHLRLDGDRLTATGQFTQAGVEDVVGKLELHNRIPRLF